jgi:hypothetical protein
VLAVLNSEEQRAVHISEQVGGWGRDEGERITYKLLLLHQHLIWTIVNNSFSEYRSSQVLSSVLIYSALGWTHGISVLG